VAAKQKQERLGENEAAAHEIFHRPVIILSAAQETATHPRHSEHYKTGWGYNDNHWPCSPEPPASITLILTFCPATASNSPIPHRLRAPDRQAIAMHSVIFNNNHWCGWNKK